MSIYLTAKRHSKISIKNVNCLISEYKTSCVNYTRIRTDLSLEILMKFFYENYGVRSYEN